ncbi:MAG: thioredoxin family protein [Candidatus Babeliaceae bacterium]|nr:thioredoxin family protein [Candidatus Babeliaceae bacterium]
MKNLSLYTLLATLTVGATPLLISAKTLIKSSASAKAEKHAYKEIQSEEEFAAEMSKPGTIVVKFHAPWCSFCKKMEPEFEKAAGMMKSDARFLSVDVDNPKLKDLAQTFKVMGLPTTVIITVKTGFMTTAELEKAVSQATGKAYGMKTTAVPAPTETPAAPEKMAPKKKSVRKN